ncbi:hypothetical protein AAF712_002833 [Marasmius tenuissimus]|uniref:Transmembrane protein n=1 Tax=Marasmius tenuissimus TaxID=585030 RepID=A0ABR3A8L3_9AGAR
MISLRGKQLGWICLTSCVIDVTINAILLFWLSAGSSPSGECRDRFSLPHMDMTALTSPEMTQITLAATRTTPERTKTTADTTGTVPVAIPKLSTLPDEFFDYVPEVHRFQKDEEGDPEGRDEGRRDGRNQLASEMREKPDPQVSEGQHGVSDSLTQTREGYQVEKPAAALISS